MKPYAEACDRNQSPILEVLEVEFSGTGSVLEIGSGTGQHAVFFASVYRSFQDVNAFREGSDDV